MINLFDVKVDKNGVAQFVLDRGFKELNVVPQASRFLTPQIACPHSKQWLSSSPRGILQ